MAQQSQNHGAMLNFSFILLENCLVWGQKKNLFTMTKFDDEA